MKLIFYWQKLAFRSTDEQKSYPIVIGIPYNSWSINPMNPWEPCLYKSRLIGPPRPPCRGAADRIETHRLCIRSLGTRDVIHLSTIYTSIYKRKVTFAANIDALNSRVSSFLSHKAFRCGTHRMIKTKRRLDGGGGTNYIHSSSRYLLRWTSQQVGTIMICRSARAPAPRRRPPRLKINTQSLKFTHNQ